MRPGYKTSEFWITLSGQVIALCVLLGLVRPGDGAPLEAALSNAVMAVFTLLASAATVVHYVSSRTNLKHRQFDQQEPLAKGWQPPVTGIVLLAALAGVGQVFNLPVLSAS